MEARRRAEVFCFAGKLSATPGPTAAAVALRVETGNRAALRALIGAGCEQAFALGRETDILVYWRGVPTLVSSADLHEGDWVTIRVRAAEGATLEEIVSRPAACLTDTPPPHRAYPLWLFRGTVSGVTKSGRLAVHVTGGNWKALHALLGSSPDRKFAHDDDTIFVRWRGRAPTPAEPSELRPGDRITIRIRAPRGAGLSQLEGTPAAHVGTHQPPPRGR